MKLPIPGDRYDRLGESQRNAVLEQSDRLNLKRNQDLELNRGARIILTAPNGSRWILTVSNTGALSTTAL